MRADADFMVYVAARWPALVREAVLLGVRPEEAADATTDALARCRRDWERTSRDEDVDAVVRAELRAAVGRRQRTDEATRERAADGLLVLAPPTLADLRHQERQNSRVALRRAALVAIPLLLVGVGTAAHFASHDDPHQPAPDKDGLGNAAVHREENPAPGVVWYADGQLHLDHAVLAIEGLRDMTRVGVGVVYGDDEGRVVYAGDDGSRRVLGHKDPDLPVAASDENGWAAWVETGSGRPTIVVEEAETGNEITRFPVDVSTRVVAVDGTSLFIVDADGAHERPAQASNTIDLRPAGLLDVRSRVQAFQRDPDTVEVVQSIFDKDLDVPGQGATLAPDGGLLVTHAAGTDEVEAFDTRSGTRLRSGLAEGDQVVAVAPGPRLTIAYIVSPVPAPHTTTPGRDLELRTCQLALGECVTAARIPNLGQEPVLAR